MINNSTISKEWTGIGNVNPGWAERNDDNYPLGEINGATSSNRIEGNIKPSSEDGSDDVLEDEDNRSAPIELLSEFLSSLMLRDYETALNQCRSILKFEPGNRTVQEFYPLIQQRINEADADKDEAESTFEDESMPSTDSRSSSVAASLDMDSSSDEYETADNTLWTSTGPGAQESDSTSKEDDDLEESEDKSPNDPYFQH